MSAFRPTAGLNSASLSCCLLLLGLFGLLGLTIAGVGVYGLMAFIVAQKTRGIGVRMALGASRTRVVGMVVAHAFALVAVGVALGSGIAARRLV